MAKERITTNEAVIQAATDLFLVNGYDKTTIRMITDRLDIHIGSLYYMYPNKEEILKILIYAFYGDILCRSSRITREVGDDEFMTLLPPAFLLYSASRSKRLARLLYQSFCLQSLVNEVLSQSHRWATRYDPQSMDMNRFRMNSTFLLGGLGNMIGTISESEGDVDLHEYLRSYSIAAFSLSDSQHVDIDRMIGDVIEYVRKEDLQFFERELDSIDSD